MVSLSRRQGALVPAQRGPDWPMSPTLPLFGAYFPSWLACTGVGVLGAAVIRVVFIRLGVDEMLPWRLLVYTCVAAIIGLAVAFVVFGR